MSTATTGVELSAQAEEAQARLDAHVRQIVEWHFNPATGCPFWLDFASKLSWDPRKEIHRYADLRTHIWNELRPEAASPAQARV